MTTPATTTPTRQCPYAVALSEDEASLEPANKKARMLMTAELSQCPAFSFPSQQQQSANGGAAGTVGTMPKCPFQGAKSSEQVKQTLANIPKSHYNEHQTSFFQVMQHLHKVHEQESANGNSATNSGIFGGFVKNLGGQCPMQPYVAAAQNDNSNNNANKVYTKKSFGRAMEDCSMAAIMARLAADMENDDDENSESHSGVEEDHVSAETGKVKATLKDDTTAPAVTTSAIQVDVPSPRNSLAEALKTGTAVSHQAAEDVHFVKNFISGKIDRHLYQEMILGLYHVYVVLEDALDEHASKVFPSCHFPEQLRRRESLEEDVEFWHNTRTPAARTISPATQDYIDRIQYLAHHNPLLLLAHSYTRYLGDLSGGKILARVARKALDLDKDSGDGLAFYRFDKVKSFKAFKDNYRQALDDLTLTPDQIAALVAEANVAFCFNMRLFQELDVMATIPGAKVMSLDEVMKYADLATTPAAKEGEDQCPFLVNKKKKEQVGDQQTQLQQQHKTGGRCPWPFVVFHDPTQFAKDWQTWFVVALVAAWFKMM